MVTTAPYDDEAALRAFAASVDVITYEFENVPTSALDLLESLRPIRPNRRALAISQDRIADIGAALGQTGVADGVRAFNLSWHDWLNLASLTEISSVITEAALALAHMHARGWIHRDIKPDNLLASPEGQVKLIDMALAVKKPGVLGRLLGGAAPRGRGLVQGTPSYMSPEQIRGQVVHARADIYSFGCTAFELLAGRPPFQSRTQAELLQMQLTSQPPSVESYNRSVPKGVVRLIRKMLSKSAASRPASMDEVVEQLRSFRKLERASQA